MPQTIKLELPYSSEELNLAITGEIANSYRKWGVDGSSRSDEGLTVSIVRKLVTRRLINEFNAHVDFGSGELLLKVDGFAPPSVINAHGELPAETVAVTPKGLSFDLESYPSFEPELVADPGYYLTTTDKLLEFFVDVINSRTDVAVKYAVGAQAHRRR